MEDNKNYWKNFYTNNNINIEPSNFCKFVIDYLKEKNIINVLDAGCGNGRDSYFLCKKYNVTGVDNSGIVLEETDRFKFINSNFIDLDKNSFDLIYSRFTLHSITNESHNIFLDSIVANTYLAIEARSIKGEVEEVIHGKTHYRNYIDLNYLKDLLLKKNFEILFIEENRDFAIYKTENPICIRVICKKL